MFVRLLAAGRLLLRDEILIVREETIKLVPWAGKSREKIPAVKNCWGLKVFRGTRFSYLCGVGFYCGVLEFLNGKEGKWEQREVWCLTGKRVVL